MSIRPVALMTNDQKRAELRVIARLLGEHIAMDLSELVSQSERMAELWQSLDSELSQQFRPLPNAWRNEMRPF